jgi:hypothetical protein
VQIFSSASEQNNKIDLNFKYKKAFRKNRNIVLFLIVLFAILSILFFTIPTLEHSH